MFDVAGFPGYCEFHPLGHMLRSLSTQNHSRGLEKGAEPDKFPHAPSMLPWRWLCPLLPRDALQRDEDEAHWVRIIG